MTKHYHLRLAGSAIAAALVLSATPVIGQDAPAAAPQPQITIVIPQPAPAPAPAPAAPVEATVAPAEQAAPAASAATPRPAASATPRRPRTAAVSQPAAPAPVTAQDVAPISATPAALQAAVDAAPAAEAPPLAAPIASSQSDGAGDELLLGAGLAAALGLGGLIALARRRRSKRAVIYDDAAPREPSPFVAAPVAARPVTPQWTSPASFALPAVIPDDMQARRALIEQMVTAKPDAANPFKTRKARTKRARIILANRAANQRPPLEDRVVARPAAPLAPSKRPLETV